MNCPLIPDTFVSGICVSLIGLTSLYYNLLKMYENGIDSFAYHF